MRSENIARVLRRRHPDATVHLEAVHPTPGHAGRSDIVLKPRVGTALSVEVQASSMAVAELQVRTVDRAADGSVVEWVFVVDRLTWTAPLSPRRCRDRPQDLSQAVG